MRSLFEKILPVCFLLVGAALAPRGAAQTAIEPPAQAPAPAPAPANAHLLKQILLADSTATAQALSFQPDGPFIVATGSLKPLESAELTKRLIAAKDHFIDKALLEGISQALLIYVRQHGYLLVDISIPEQSIADGALRLAVVPGKFRQIKFVGNRYFSESQLLGDLHVERGEIIHFSALEEAISWTNDRNPFRRLQAHVEQVPNSNEADLIVGVQERSPLRLVAAVDDSGNETLGKNHYTFGATYANLWNLDHQATYQYITTGRGQNFIGHVFSYRAPLPWRHFVQFSATYLQARPVLFGGYFNQNAQNITGDVRYTIPVWKGDNPGEIFANVGFKESNNDLEFGGTNVGTPITDIFQLTVGASRVHRDKRGAWVFGVNATFSPGHLDSRNTDDRFFTSRGGAKSRYAYATLSFQRLQRLDRGWEFSARGNVQIADGNLLSSEDLGAGGAATVRGFDENVFSGDEGFVFGNDLLSPIWRQRISVRGKQFVPLETRFLAFYDVAHVRSKIPFALDPKFKPLASTGVGVRMNWANSFSLSADYGWQITHLPYAHTDHGRGHLKVSLAY